MGYSLHRGQPRPWEVVPGMDPRLERKRHDVVARVSPWSRQVGLNVTAGVA